MTRLSRTVKSGVQHRNASFLPSSYNEEARTIEVVFATERAIREWSWAANRYINQILEISEAAVDFSRLHSGAPVLDSHRTWGLSSIIGVVEEAWIEGKEARAKIRFSKRPEIASLIDDITSGIIRNVSVGFAVRELKLVSEEKGETPTYRAVKWEPMEISFVPVGADKGAGTRADNNNSQQFTTTINTTTMDVEEVQTPNSSEASQGTQPATGRSASQGSSAPTPESEAPAAAPAPTAPAAPPSESTRSAAEAAIAAERQRVSDIQTICRRANMDEEFTATLISEGTSVSEARAQILEAMVSRSNPAPRTSSARVTGEDEAQQIRSAIIDGISERANPGTVEGFAQNERARRYANMRLIDIARDRLRARGESFDLLSESETVRRAWSTTDYPDLLTGTFDRTLHRVITGMADEWRWTARQTSASDFRQKTGLTVDGNVTFEEIPESGEYRSAPILANEKMNIQLKKYGRKYSISDIAIINDDLDVFSRLPQMIAVGAEQFQSNQVWALITGNALAPDGKALFHADHSNLAASTGAVISETTLSAGRTAMRRQLSPSGQRLGVRPKFLLVPPELETAAEKMISSILATKTGDVNVFANKLEVRVSDQLTDTKAWYLVADPAMTMIDGLVYAYLSGQEGLRTASRINWDTDALEVKASMAFACAVWGYAGWYKNPGGA